ncbi:MAG: hypothetical protein NT068_02365 [Candidatus Nomurabacteria bacterium]|nr:hypothetical protein [Candidatus Nomurabacteria bacterium]
MHLQRPTPPNSYGVPPTSVCEDLQVQKLFTAAHLQTQSNASCFVSADSNSYSASVTLNDHTDFCVDSSGFAGVGTAVPVDADGNASCGAAGTGGNNNPLPPCDLESAPGSGLFNLLAGGAPGGGDCTINP